MKVPLREDPLPAKEREVMNPVDPKEPAQRRTDALLGQETPIPGRQGKEPRALEKKPTPEKENPSSNPQRKAEVSPSQSQQPVAAAERSGQKSEGFPLTRTVRNGETLFRMTMEVYGTSTPELWDLVRKRNPQIKEDLKIKVGQKVIFPEWEATAKSGN